MKKIVVIMLALTLLISTLSISYATQVNENEKNEEDIVILMTNDMHSNFEQDEEMGIGGFAKVATLWDQVRDEYPKSFLFDGGDFAMGTPFQVLFQTTAAEIRLMGEIEFDATVLGNHEFDHRTVGLTNMLNTASETGEALPEILIANIDWEATFADEELEGEARKLKEACDKYGVKDYTVIERDGVKIAVFGIMGKEADDYAPESGLIFKDQVTTAQEVVKTIEENEDVDLIVCLSHSGLDEDDPKKSEDEILAQEVPEIDLILSGHSHTMLHEPIIYGDTVIGAAGEYTKYVAKVTFEKDGDSYKYKDYELVPLDENVDEKESVINTIAEYRKLIDDRYFEEYGYSIDQVLTNNSHDFGEFEEFGVEQGEETLGNILADAILYSVEKAEGDDYEPVYVSVVPHGVIRASLPEGDITVEDLFKVLSLGIGPDGMNGYPLVGVYLTGEEIKTAAEVDISVSEIMGSARLYPAGLQYEYNPNRLLLNRVTDVKFQMPDGSVEEIEDEKLYRVVADLYSCQMLGTVEDQSFGLLKVTPKDKDGNVITDFEEHIIYSEDGKELKQWYATAMYFQSFEGGEIPDKYADVEGRKIENDSKNIVDILKNPNKIFWMLIGAIVSLILIIVLIGYIFTRVYKKTKLKKY